MRRPHRYSFTPRRHGTTPFGFGCYGGWGAEAVDELVKRGADPETIVVVDDRMVELDATEAWGTTVMQGDATRNAALEAVQLARARALFVAAGWDDTSDPDRPEPSKSRRRSVGRVGPTARISRRINGSRRGRRTGRPARTSTDRDRGGTRTVGNPCWSRPPYLPGRSKLWVPGARHAAARDGGSHRRGSTARSGRTHHLPILSVTNGSGSDVRTTKSAHLHQASSVEIGFRAAIWTGLPITGRPAGHRRAIQRSFAIRAMVTASP